MNQNISLLYLVRFDYRYVLEQLTRENNQDLVDLQNHHNM